MNKFEELLAKYGKTAEEVTFEVEGLSDEELETKFAEAFEDDAGEPEGDNGDGEGDNTDDNQSGDGEGNSDDNGDGEGEGTFASRKLYSIDDNGNATITFEISHEDIRGALYSLISIYEEEDNEWYWIANVYDDYFIFENWMGDKLYKQSYSVDGDNVSLSGDRQEMFKMILTESEKLAIEKMREDYTALEEQYNELKAFKADTEAVQLQAQKDAIFAREEFAGVVNTKAFKKLIDNSKDYTVEECEQRAKDILDDCKDYMANFAANDDGKKKPQVIGFANANKPEKEKPYGDIFDD